MTARAHQGEPCQAGTDKLRTEAVAKFARCVTGNGNKATDIPWLSFFRSDVTTLPQACVYEAIVAVILQGRKHVVVSGEQMAYDESRFLLSAIDLPVVTYVAEASEAHPFMAMIITLDFAKIRQMILDYDIPAPKVAPIGRAIGTAPVTGELLSASSRLLDLLDTPERIPVMSDLLFKEIVLYMLESEQGGRLWHLAMTGSQSNRIQKVISWLRRHYAEPLRSEDLARMAAMSVSSMRQHFHDITGMSPLQFQKQLRLQEARRLMMVEDLDAAMAGMRVGYDSPSQFSREYARLFGQPPIRDIKQLRATPASLGPEPEAARPILTSKATG